MLGLHQEITIIYIVTGYQATFFTNDGATPVAVGIGETIDEAMVNMRKKMTLYTKVNKYRFDRLAVNLTEEN